MDPIVKQLIVLQIIYSLIIPKVEQESIGHPNLSINENSIISSNIKLSLVKLTNEIQNSLLVNEINRVYDENKKTPSNKLNINDILQIIKELFPLQRTILADGQLSFHNLKIIDIKKLIIEKYELFQKEQLAVISELDDQILNIGGTGIATTTATTGTPTPNTTPTPTTTPTPPLAKKTQERKPSNQPSMDPKREKLLQLYRDTVLNKLQSKNKILDKLYANLDKEPTNSKAIVIQLMEIDKIKRTTPVSVHNLQLILTKLVSDSVMCSQTDSITWNTARHFQTELDDTVQFMRRALE